MILLFDVAVPGGGALLAGVGVVFVIALAAVAYIAFRIFRRTMKMALRSPSGVHRGIKKQLKPLGACANTRNASHIGADMNHLCP